MEDRITLDYGSGGLKTSQFIDSILIPAFQNPILSELGDGAVLDGHNKLIFSTDSFVVSPWRFPGGDIGKLCVCGTVKRHGRSEEHTSELQSRFDVVCRLLLEKKKTSYARTMTLWN